MLNLHVQVEVLGHVQLQTTVILRVVSVRAYCSDQNDFLLIFFLSEFAGLYRPIGFDVWALDVLVV